MTTPPGRGEPVQGDSERLASSRAERSGTSRLARTIVLGTLAAGAGIWWLGRAYDVDSSRLLGYLLASILFVVVLIALAVAGGFALRLLRRRRGIFGQAQRRS